MKIRPVVRASTITDLLNGDRQKLEEALGMTNSRLDSLNKGTIITSLHESDSILREQNELQERIGEIDTKLKVLGAVEGPMIPVEFEV